MVSSFGFMSYSVYVSCSCVCVVMFGVLCVVTVLWSAYVYVSWLFLVMVQCCH